MGLISNLLNTIFPEKKPKTVKKPNVPKEKPQTFKSLFVVGEEFVTFHSDINVTMVHRQQKGFRISFTYVF